MQLTDSPEDLAQTAEKIRSGEYFREARTMYDKHVHDPMAERYWYLLITGLSLLILLIAFVAMQSLYPLKRTVPFIVSTNDIIEDMPHIQTMMTQKGDTPSEALLRFMVENYVQLRENYDIGTFDRNINGVKSQSTQDVASAFDQAITPTNPESPITLYQRHSKRSIAIISAQRTPGRNDEMQVVYEATVDNPTDIKKSTWQANISFRYSGITLDESAGKAKPVGFIVTEYRTKPLQG